MNKLLRKDKQDIREFIQQQFTDEKLASVYAFNRDGKMEFYNTCSCLMGVTLSDHLHHKKCPDSIDRNGFKGHYRKAQILPLANAAEIAYGQLGYPLGSSYKNEDKLDLGLRRRLRLSAILRAEMRRRDRIRASKMVESQDAAELVLA